LSVLSVGCMGKKGKTMIDKSRFPELLKKVRTRLGLSQEDLAVEMDVSFATINRWENGKTVPFKLAMRRFEEFCKRMAKVGKINLKEIGF